MSGIKDGEFDRVIIASDLGVGRRSDFGTSGQVLTSAGQNNELFWGTNSATLPESLSATSPITFTPSGSYNGSVATSIGVSLSALTFGTGITATPNQAYDGSTAITITADSDTTLNLIAGSGINITPNGNNRTITANIDNDTLDFTSSVPKAILVKKLPHTLTITDSSGASVVFDGDQDKSITISDSDTTYQGGDGIEIDTSTPIHTIKADLKADSGLVFTGGEIDLDEIPNTALENSTISGKALGSNLANLVKGDNITFTPDQPYNGSTEITISTTAPDGGITTLIGGDGIIVEDDSATQKTIKADLKADSGLVFTGGEIDLEDIPNSALENSTISGKELGTNLANLVKGDNITFTPDQPYNGSTEITISTTAPDGGITTLIGGDGIIVEDDSATQKTIKADLKSGSGLTFTGGEIDLEDIPNSALENSTISGKELGTNLASLTAGSGISFSSGTTFDGSAPITMTATTDATTRTITKAIYPTTINPSAYQVYRRQITNSRSLSMLMYPIDDNFNYTFNHTPVSRYYKVDIQFSIVNSTTANGIALEPVLIRLDKDNSNTNGWGFPSKVLTAHKSGNKAMNTTITIILDLGTTDYTAGSGAALPKIHPVVIQQSASAVSPSEGRRATNENAIIYYGGGATSINGCLGLTMVITPLSDNDTSISTPTTGSPYTIPITSGKSGGGTGM